ncbi:LPXTG cell wall anchor domain-containing protein [Enterococcus sp. AZ109]|uniref:LPXTG cell wall anchor domain-containing protein n=1 Tax=Enterococcus sp. AZ109 TaxID=2774634 RepID=UPI003F28B227
MKYFSTMINCLVMLGCFIVLAPLSALAVSNADSEVSIRFSEWADDPQQQPVESTVGGGTAGKRYPQTGEKIRQAFTTLGIVLIGFILLIIYKRRKEKTDEKENH